MAGWRLDGLHTAKRIGLRIGICGVLGLLPTCGTVAVAPVATRLAAPLVCPSGTAHSVVVSWVKGSSRGGASLKWDLYCINAEGFGYIPSTPKIVLGLAAIWGGLALVHQLLLVVIRMLAARARREGAGHEV